MASRGNIMLRPLGAASCCLILVLIATANCDAAGPYTSKEIFAQDRAAIVLVFSQSQPRGTGFIVSGDGIVITANHVVTSPDLKTYLPNIQVNLNDGSTITATPVETAPTVKSINGDYAVLKTNMKKAPHLTLGAWDEAEPGDALTTMGFPFGVSKPLLLSLMLSGLASSETANFIIFQGPANRGFSGGPLISNITGNVIGIVSTKIAGITPGLDAARTSIQKTGGGSGVFLGGVDPNAAILDLINVLDNSLISGMGTAVAINPAKVISWTEGDSPASPR